MLNRLPRLAGRALAATVLSAALVGCSGSSTAAPIPTMPSIAPVTPAPTPTPAGSAVIPSLAPGQVLLKVDFIEFVPTNLEVKAGTPFQIVFANEDAGIPHDIVLHRQVAGGPVVWQSPILRGVDVAIYDVPALDAGTYVYVCSVHPESVGTLTVR